MEKRYYYINGTMGMKSHGSFTRDKSKWVTFSQSEMESITSTGRRPYGSTKDGVFVEVK